MTWLARLRRQTANGSPHDRRRFNPVVAGVMIAGTLLSVLLALALARQNNDSRLLRFRADAQVAATAIQQQLVFAVHDLDALRSLFVSSNDVSRAEFSNYVELHHHSFAVPGLIGLAWLPRVPAAERIAYAAAGGEGTSGAAIWEPGATGPEPASARTDSFPIEYIAPLAGNEPMLGLDLGAGDVTASALETARDTGRSQVVNGVQLGSTSPHTETLLVVQPVYQAGFAPTTITERRTALAGYVAGLYSVPDLVASAVQPLPMAGRNLFLFDAMQPASTPTYSVPSQLDPMSNQGPPPTLGELQIGDRFSQRLTVDGIPWLLVETPVPGYGQGWQDLLPWIALLSGLAVTALSATYLHKRQQTERRLRRERTLLRTLLDAIPDLVYYRDTDGVLLGCNQAFVAAHGLPEADLVGRTETDMASALGMHPAVLAPRNAPGASGPGASDPDASDPDASTWGDDGSLHNRRQWVTRADGSRILYETLVAPLYGPKATVTGALEVSRDVTASWRTARLLQARLALSEFATDHSLEALLRRALDQAEELTASAIGFFHFLDEDQQALSLQTWSTNTLAAMCTAEPAERHYPVAQAGVWAECVRSGQPVVCNDYAALDRSAAHLPAGHAPVARFLSMPIQRGERVVAVMGVGDKPLPYDDADVTMLAQFASAAWDVILRKRAEAATAVSLEKYRVLFESFPLGITVSDKEGRIIEVNAESERLLGLSVADHLERTIDDPRWRIIRPDGSPLPSGEYASVRALHEHQLVRDVRMGIVKPERGVSWISATAAPIPLDDYGLAITYNDITEQQQLERLQAAQFTVSRVLAESPDFRQAMPGLLQTVTQQLGWDGAELWLLDPATARLNRFWTWYRPDQPGLAHFAAESTAFTFAPHEGAPGIVLASNEPLWFLLPEHPTYPRAQMAQACGIQTGFVVPISAGSQVLAVLGMVSLACLPRDERMIECLVDLGRQIAQFAARKQAEADLQAERGLLAQRVEERTADLSFANLQLGHALRAKDEFLANMSHELRTPLHGILTLAESLLTQSNSSLSQRQVRSLELIEQSGEHLLELINDILDLAKVEAGKLTVEPEPVDVGALCRSSVQLMRELATKKEVRLTLDLDEPDLRVTGDGRRLKQVLVNLLSNAIKFTPMGGSVRLRVKPDAAADTLAFCVIDTGIGIAPDKLGLLFQPFTQLDSGLTRSHEGTGLGLALVRRLVELHGGAVHAESEGIPGRGSRFTITLPWQPPAPATAPSSRGEDALSGSTPLSGDDAPSRSARPAPAPVRTRTLLVAEDNELNRTALADYLEGNGFRVLTAANGLEAIDLATERQPDLILMDVQMPVVDGLEAIRRLRAASATATIPIVALTALAMVGDRERCLAAGADAYLAKPISLRDMTAQVEALLR